MVEKLRFFCFGGRGGSVRSTDKSMRAGNVSKIEENKSLQLARQTITRDVNC